MTTPFSSSSSSSSGKMEYEDASIYFCVERDFRVHEWYVIKGNSKTPEDKLLRPIFPPPPKHQHWSGCCVVGSTIYVLGGIECDSDRYFLDRSTYDDVYYIDTRRPSCGWKKGCPMTTPRANPYAVTVDSKMYVLGGVSKLGLDISPWAEVFDGQTQVGGSWRGLRDGALMPYQACGHALMDYKRKILFHGHKHEPPCLYSYDIESNTWGIYSESSLGDYRITSSAFVDGILYGLDGRHPGIYGLDVSNPENQIQKVLGCVPYDHEWYEGCLPEDEFLVSLGNSNLVVIWFASRRDLDGLPDREKLDVCCSKLKMSKCLNATSGQIDFVATPLSLSCYSVMGSQLVDCLAVFPAKKCELEEEVSKNASTNNGSNNNNDSEKKKKKNRNRNRNRVGNKKKQV